MILANHDVISVKRNKKILRKRKNKDTCDIVLDNVTMSPTTCDPSAIV